MSDVPELKKRILEDGHINGLNTCPKATNIFQEQKRIFWYPGVKKDVAGFMYCCLVVMC